MTVTISFILDKNIYSSDQSGQRSLLMCLKNDCVWKENYSMSFYRIVTAYSESSLWMQG